MDFSSVFNTQDPHFWVSLAFVLLVGLSFKKVAKLLAGVLDARGLKIKSELDAAKKLRAEAEEVLFLYKKKQQEFAKEADEILAKAREDADRNSANAQAELKTVLEARMKSALEKIEQEEAAAVAEVRNHIVGQALLAARNIVIQQMSNESREELVRLTIADIEHKIH